MRRLIVAFAVTVLAVGWAATPAPGSASCAGTATLEQIAREPGAAVFTGRATGELPRSDDVAFAVDRWFDGPHAARTIHLLGSTAYVIEPATGVVPAVLARATAGDAVSLVRDMPVLMVATWDAANDVFAVRFCTVAGVPLDSPEGRDALREAVSVFGRGRHATDLPSTDALRPALSDRASTMAWMRDWWLLVLAAALAASLVLVQRRHRT